MPEVPTPLAAKGQGSLESFVRLDRIGAALGVVVVVIGNAVIIRDSQAWLVLPPLLALIVALTFAQSALAQGKTDMAITLVALPNWVIAVAVSILFPFLWPVMTVTVLMPLVLATPYLTKARLSLMIVGAALFAGLTALAGLLNDDGGVLTDLDDTAELFLVIGALTAQIVPIGLIVSQHNLLEHRNLDQLETLNADLVSSQRELGASRNRVVAAADTERRRIERDLHDGAQQRLVALGVRLRLLESQGQEDPAVSSAVTTLIGELDAAIEEVRELAHGIYPPLLQTRGLSPALAAVARRSPLDVHSDIAEIGRYDESTETALYFTALEALTNAAKHAPGASVDLRLTSTAEGLELIVVDNGPGFDVDETIRSHGTNNMGDRLAVVGGTLVVSSRVGEGTTVHAKVPVSR